MNFYLPLVIGPDYVSQHPLMGSTFYSFLSLPRLISWGLHFIYFCLSPDSYHGVYILFISVSPQTHIMGSTFYLFLSLPRLISWGLHFIYFCLSPDSYHGVYILLISVSTPTHIMGSTFYLFLSSLKFNIPNLWRHILELLWNQTLVNGKLWLSEVFWSWIFGVIFCAARVNNKIHKSTPQLGNQSCRDLDHLGN